MEPLPALPPITRLSPRVIRILGGNPGKYTLQGTNTYLLGTGRSRLLLDTGEGRPAWRAALAQTLREEDARVEAILLTHWHGDHVGGVKDALDVAREVAEAGAGVGVGAGGEGEGMPRVYKNQARPGEGQADVRHGDVFAVEGARVRAVHCPGHTVDHVGFVLAEEDAMFVGDNVLGHGTAVFEDLAVYVESLGRMRGEFAGRAYPGHGEVVEDGAAKIGEYIAHRRQREGEAVETLRGREAGMGSMEMVKVIYAQYPEHLHGPAEGSLLQVLKKLEGEGKVRQDGDGKWSLTEKATL